MRPALTERQAQALKYISDCLTDRGYPPTLREIGEHMGIKSTNGVNDHLKALERKGYLMRQDAKSRALILTQRYGKGRVVALNYDRTYHMRFGFGERFHLCAQTSL